MGTEIIKDPNWLQAFTENVIAPVIVAAVAYFLFGKIEILRRRRSYSILGVAVLSSLIEEVQNGRNIIRDTLTVNNNVLPNALPRKSWTGINTITDEILLRILAVTKGNKDIGFPATEIRIHTKNYFEYMAVNWDQVVEAARHDPDYKTIVRLQYFTYDEAATGVLNMLENIRGLLEDNSKKWFPR